MTLITDLLAAGPTWSIEFFPPRTEEGERQFDATIRELAPLHPSFASVTYGALGSTKARTRDLVVTMNADLPFPTMAHLTCVGHTHAEITELLDGYAAAGVHNILALGGDPPEDGGGHDGQFSHAIELVRMIREHPAEFAVGVAAHPEVHPRSPDRASDRLHLAAKLRDADFAITQFFFTIDDYLRLVDELGALGCDRPVIPGVMPFVSATGLRRMSAMNHTAIPPALAARLDACGDDTAVADLGIAVATDLSRGLIDAGAPGVHLYTLNRAASVHRVRDNLGLGARHR
ncbi:MAG: methylenetetrahydrofolate reductase [Thermoleophilia bacterium]